MFWLFFVIKPIKPQNTVLNIAPIYIKLPNEFRGLLHADRSNLDTLTLVLQESHVALLN